MTTHRTSGGRRSEILERDVEMQLAEAWLERQDKKARDRLILAYRPLALTLATTIAKQSGMNVEDLAQEAFLALTSSIDKFDPSMGNRFGTFARWHIVGELNRHVMDFFGPCRVGTNLSDKKVFMQFRKRRAEIEARTQRPLDDEGREEIAMKIGVPVEVIRRMEPRLSSHDASLDEPIGGDGDGEGSMTRGQLLVDNAPSPEEQAIREMDGGRINSVLKELLSELPEREQAILRARLMGDSRIQLADLGDGLGVTKERVRQLERKALKSLRGALEEMGYSKEHFLAS